MSSKQQKNEFDAYAKDMSPNTFNEVVRLYKEYGEHLNTESSSWFKMLVNWIFLVNTGGVALLVTFVATGHPVFWIRRLLMIPSVFFILGIIMIIVSAKLKLTFLYEKGEQLEIKFKGFQKDEIKGSELENHVFHYENKKISISRWLELLSFIFCVFGLSFSLFILIRFLAR